MTDDSTSQLPHADNKDVSSALPLDVRLAKELALRAAKAICDLWDPTLRTFWRSTEHRNRQEDNAESDTFFPTVTFRCTEALLDLITYCPEWTSKEIRETLAACVSAVQSHTAADINSTLDVDTKPGIHNPFTTSLYLSTLCKSRLVEVATPVPADEIERRIIVGIGSLKETCEAKETHEGHIHPFIQFHAVRALLESSPVLEDKQETLGIPAAIHNLALGVRANIEKLLARHALGRLAPSEAVALIFCAGSLALTGFDDDERYVLSALEVGFQAQDATGCWPLGRVIHVHKDLAVPSIEISTYEIAWAAAEVLLSIAKHKRKALLSPRVLQVVEKLVLSGKFAQASLIELPTERHPRKGWCSDHPYGRPLIESWTSANVLQAAVLSYLLIERVNREIVLNTFVTVDPKDEDWPSWLRWQSYTLNSEPEDDHPILEYIDERIVKAIKRSPRDLPSSEGESVSVLLFGPPGTSKTTLVKAVADGLGWPVVLLSPGDFISEGLEYIEAQARSVFDRLQMLSRAVILFDECDELFRNRNPSEAVEQLRGITAFVTASMLPKLQELHDRGRVVFFISTNKFETLDPAIKRGGRIDHVIAVGPPQRTARVRIIAADLKSIADQETREAITEELANQADGFTRSEIKRICALLVKEGKWEDKRAARKVARKLAENARDSLTILAREYQDFKDLKKKVSRPVMEGRSGNA